MKKLTPYLLAGVSVLTLTIFQNCGNGSETGASSVQTATSASTAPVTTPNTTPSTTTTPTTTTAGSGDATYQALLDEIFAEFPLASYLSELGISSSSYSAILPAALANSTATAASIESASSQIIAEINSHAYVFALLSSSEKSSLLTDVNTALTKIRSVNASTLNEVNQVSQQQVILILDAFAANL